MTAVTVVVGARSRPEWAVPAAQALLDAGYRVLWCEVPEALPRSFGAVAEAYLTRENVALPPAGVTLCALNRTVGPLVWGSTSPAPLDKTVFRVRLAGQCWPSSLVGLPGTAGRLRSCLLSVSQGEAGVERQHASGTVRADPRSPLRTRAAAASKVGALLVQALSSPSEDAVVTQPRLRTPGAVASVGKIGARWALDRWRLRGHVDQWQIGFRFGEDPLSPDGFTWPEPPLDRFWADPVPLVHDGAYYVFYEELLYSDWIGRLNVARVYPDGRFEPLGVVLEMPTHLSFPQVFHADGELWMVPETLALGEIALYRCVDFPLRWERHCRLAEGRWVDTAVFETDDGWAMLTSRTDGPAESGNDNLYAATAPSLQGPWTGLNRPVCVDIHGARMGGAPARVDGKWVRPAQDCAVRYGHQLRLSTVHAVGADHLEETPLMTWSPQSGERARHSWGVAGDLVVTDRQVRRKR